MSLLFHKRPSELLNLKGSPMFLFEVDYQLVSREMKRLTEGKDESEEEKIKKMKEWKKHVP